MKYFDDFPTWDDIFPSDLHPIAILANEERKTILPDCQGVARYVNLTAEQIRQPGLLKNTLMNETTLSSPSPTQKSPKGKHVPSPGKGSDDNDSPSDDNAEIIEEPEKKKNLDDSIARQRPKRKKQDSDPDYASPSVKKKKSRKSYSRKKKNDDKDADIDPPCIESDESKHTDDEEEKSKDNGTAGTVVLEAGNQENQMQKFDPNLYQVFLVPYFHHRIKVFQLEVQMYYANKYVTHIGQHIFPNKARNNTQRTTTTSIQSKMLSLEESLIPVNQRVVSENFSWIELIPIISVKDHNEIVSGAMQVLKSAFKYRVGLKPEDSDNSEVV